MGTLLFQHSSTFTSFMILMLLVRISYCQDEDDGYEVCSKSFDCGNLKNLSYPFWNDNVTRPLFCGQEEFKLICREGQDPMSEFEGLHIFIKNVSLSTNTMTIAIENFCPVMGPGIGTTSLNETLFRYSDTEGLQVISFFYDCDRVPETIPAQNTFSCPPTGEGNRSFYTSSTASLYRDLQCRYIIEILVPRGAMKDVMSGIEELRRVGREGFNVTYDNDDRCSRCKSSGGICGTNTTTADFACYCDRDHPDPHTCFRDGDDPNVKLKVAIGVSAGVGGALLVCLIGHIVYRRRKKNIFALSSWVSKSMTTSYTSSKLKSDIEKSGSEFKGVQVHLFSYDELDEATNNFAPANELGDGGFGTVYKGKLRDKRVVAVKRLYENNYKRVEQFMNEVELLTGLRHPNLVSLYGCTSRHSRELLLVYEYIPNGTVADHLHGDRKRNSGLPWSIRMKIAVETATALAFLHACDIIHRDVKTNNILLDNYFVVKVADFGLSRLFPMDVTHVSTAPQGTPGYVDPEYHECYQLTVKSDVYSFGVVLAELISSLPAVDITRHRHEINLSNMAINKIQSDALHELVDKNLGYETDYKVRKMINAVAELAFQCLQSAKEMRPSMVDVLENLKRIQGSENMKMNKTEDSEIQSDHVGLLKNGQLPPSPDTVTAQWSSSSYSTTSNTSG